MSCSRVMHVWATVALGTLATSCGGDPPSAGPSSPSPPTVSSVQVAPATASLAAIGATQQFTAVAKDGSGNTISNKTFTWSSSNTSAATVNSSGLVAAVANGTTAITAAVDGISGSASLTVAQTGNAIVITAQPAGAAAGVAFTTQPVLEVRDAQGNLVAGDNTTVVTASIASGGGSFVGTATATTAGGVAAFADLGISGTVGDRTLQFTSQGLAAATSSSVTVTSGPAVAIAEDGGNNQTALAATTLPTSFSVKVVDAFDNGVQGASVTWTVTAGSGTLSSASTSTDGNGIASVSYTLGLFAGVESVEATSTSLAGSPIAFSATATPNGTISGVVTLSNQFLAPPPQSRAGMPGPGLVIPSASKSYEPARASTLRQPSPAWSRWISEPEFVPGELLVTYHAGPLSAPSIGSLQMASMITAQAVSGSIRRALSPYVESARVEVKGISPAILAARLRVRDGTDLDALAEELRADPAVAAVEKNFIVRLENTVSASAAPSFPNDPLYAYQAWHYAMIDLPEAWSLTTGGASVVVAVVDAGIRFDHVGIAANLTADGYDFVSSGTLIPVCAGGSIDRSGDGDGFDSDPTNPLDALFDPILGCITGASTSGNHGLHVAGTIGAVGNDGDGGTGVNWTVSVRPVRVLDIIGSGNTFDIAQGLLYAAGLPADDGAGGTVQAPSGAPIINMSLGGPTPTTVGENAVIAANDAGSLIIAAAGNAGTSDPQYPAAYSQTLSVSAVGPDFVLSSFSTFGSTIDIAAPGGDISDGGNDFGILSTAWDYFNGLPIWDNTNWNGTSMAAPHVSGVAALLLAQDPSLTAADLKARLMDYSVDLGPVGRDDSYGAGLVNARNSLTQTFAPAADLFVQLIDASSGAILQTVAAQLDGSYAFTELGDGDYYVFAGQDEEGDLQIGIPTRRWGALGGSATPSVVTVNGAGTSTATFDVGFPDEIEPNDTFASPNTLPVGGYFIGSISAVLTDADVFAVQVPADGDYTFEALALLGACGFALGEDTILQLYDAGGTLLVESDNVDVSSNNYCSRITATLNAGSYFVVVFGREALPYVVSARSGS